MLKVGDQAPAFSGVDQEGKSVRLSDGKGKKIVLYFYPRDLTPGCTVEACGFRDLHDAIQKKGAVVWGVSRDSAALHEKFTAKHGLPFRLISDDSGEMVKAYGAWGEKTLYGKKYQGILRVTYIVGPDGKIAAVFPKVKPAVHAQEVLDAL